MLSLACQGQSKLSKSKLQKLFGYCSVNVLQNTKAPTNSNNNCRSPQRGTAVAALSAAFAKLSSAEDSGKSLGDSFVHINSTSSQKGAAMTALSSVVDSAKDSSILGKHFIPNIQQPLA